MSGDPNQRVLQLEHDLLKTNNWAEMFRLLSLAERYAQAARNGLAEMIKEQGRAQQLPSLRIAGAGAMRELEACNGRPVVIHGEISEAEKAEARAAQMGAVALGSMAEMFGAVVMLQGIVVVPSDRPGDPPQLRLP